MFTVQSDNRVESHIDSPVKFRSYRGRSKELDEKRGGEKKLHEKRREAVRPNGRTREAAKTGKERRGAKKLDCKGEGHFVFLFLTPHFPFPETLTKSGFPSEC